MSVRKPEDATRSIATSLLQRVQEHEPDAWQRFVTLFGPVIYRGCRQSGLQADDAEDVVQEVLHAVNNNVGKFRRNQPGDTFRGWVWMVTKNKIRDFFRRNALRDQPAGGTIAHRILHQVPDSINDDAEESMIAESEASLTHGALELVKAEFEPASWEAFWRTAVDGQKPADVAADTGMTLAAVYKAKSRVLRREREELEGLLE